MDERNFQHFTDKLKSYFSEGDTLLFDKFCQILLNSHIIPLKKHCNQFKQKCDQCIFTSSVVSKKSALKCSKLLAKYPNVDICFDILNDQGSTCINNRDDCDDMIENKLLIPIMLDSNRYASFSSYHMDYRNITECAIKGYSAHFIEIKELIVKIGYETATRIEFTVNLLWILPLNKTLEANISSSMPTYSRLKITSVDKLVHVMKMPFNLILNETFEIFHLECNQNANMNFDIFFDMIHYPTNKIPLFHLLPKRMDNYISPLPLQKPYYGDISGMLCHVLKKLVLVEKSKPNQKSKNNAMTFQVEEIRLSIICGTSTWIHKVQCGSQVILTILPQKNHYTSITCLLYDNPAISLQITNYDLNPYFKFQFIVDYEPSNCNRYQSIGDLTRIVSQLDIMPNAYTILEHFGTHLLNSITFSFMIQCTIEAKSIELSEPSKLFSFQPSLGDLVEVQLTNIQTNALEGVGCERLPQIVVSGLCCQTKFHISKTKTDNGSSLKPVIKIQTFLFDTSKSHINVKLNCLSFGSLKTILDVNLSEYSHDWNHDESIGKWNNKFCEKDDGKKTFQMEIFKCGSPANSLTFFNDSINKVSSMTELLESLGVRFPEAIQECIPPVNALISLIFVDLASMYIFVKGRMRMKFGEEKVGPIAKFQLYVHYLLCMGSGEIVVNKKRFKCTLQFNHSVPYFQFTKYGGSMLQKRRYTDIDIVFS